jgi:hypothetical protein
MRSANFELPSEENLAMLDVPPYREVLEVGIRGFLHDIFGKKDDNKEPGLKTQEKTASEQAREQTKPAKETEKKPFWQSMKEIFKKKSK